MSNPLREEFENDLRFRGMDFTRSASNPEYYESPYANGAWDGWQAGRAALRSFQAEQKKEADKYRGLVSGTVF